MIIEKDNNEYICNKVLVNELMAFITTPCGCMSKK